MFPIRSIIIDIIAAIVCSRVVLLLVLDLTPSARWSISLLLLHLHRSVHIILLMVSLLLMVRVECLLALAVEDGTTALVFGDAAQLIVKVATVHLPAAVLVVIVGANRAAFVVEGVIAEVLIAEARVVHGSHGVVAEVLVGVV